MSTNMMRDILTANETVTADMINSAVGADVINPIYDANGTFIGTAKCKPIDDGKKLLAKIRYTTQAQPSIIPDYVIRDGVLVINGYKTEDTRKNESDGNMQEDTQAKETATELAAETKSDTETETEVKTETVTETEVKTETNTEPETKTETVTSNTSTALEDMVKTLLAKVESLEANASIRKTPAQNANRSTSNVWSKVMERIK